MLALDGQLLAIKSIRITSLVKEFKDQDMSGQTSATDVSEQGDKPAKITFAGYIPFSNRDALIALYNLASKKDESNERHVYRIGHEEAAALKIRNVRFSGSLQVSESESLMAWNVSFVLKEHHSVAEQKEQRTKEQTKPEQKQNTQLKAALAQADEAVK